MRAEAENRILNIQTTERDAQARAAEVVEKLKGGADFAKLVDEYSEDAPSKGKGGDFGVVDVGSSHPDEIKKAVLRLKAGETSAPVRLSNAYLIIRVEDKTPLTLEQVQGVIVAELRRAQINVWFSDVTRRFQPTVVDPKFFTQPAQVPQLAAPPAPTNR